MKQAFLLIILGISLLFAAPLRDLPLTVSQPDGSEIQIFASGDEFHNWLHDKENYSIVQDDKGWYVYARQDGEKVAPTSIRVGSGSAHKAALSPGINLSQNEIARRYERLASLRDYSNARSPHSGQFNNLVIYIRFADDPDFSHPQSYYEAMFNDTATNANSMKNYFIAASYDQLYVDSFFYPTPNGEIILSYVDSQPRNYYRKLTASNPIGYDENDDWERTYREQTLLANASTYVANQVPMNLAIDGDNDGYIDNVCYIIQGSPDGWAELLWPHRWALFAVDAFINGKQVWDFNFQLENSLGSSGASVLSHEMFHSLGAPDLYRYVDNTIDPIGSWDIMCSNSNPPQHMGAWMKHRYGQWIPAPPIITQSGSYQIHPLASSSTNNAYRIPSWKNGQYYMVEYRKAQGIYDSNLPGTGLIVYRLFPEEAGNADGPPDELYLYRPYANNTTTNGSLSSAHFSAGVNRTKINETTVPSGFMNDNSPGGLNIYNIGFAGDTISFDIRISDVQLTVPQGNEVWFAGAHKQIQWQRKSSSGTVKLEFSSDNGSSWSVIGASLPNSGHYTWVNIPHVDSQECFIRITLNNNGHQDSNVLAFSVITSIAIPTLVYPEENAVNIPTNPLFEWEAVQGATGYYFELADNPGFSPTLVSLMDHRQNTYRASGLSPFTTYYWRVATISDADIGISLFSETSVFTTGSLSEVPSVPSLVSPANMAANQPRNPTLVWNSSPLAEYYRLQISADPFFNALTVYQDEIYSTSFIPEPLAANTSYFWRVAAVNGYAASNYSGVRRFSTGNTLDNAEEASPALQNKLGQNQPNPFKNHTSIAFSLKNPDTQMSLNIYNTKGQKVRSLYQGYAKAASGEIIWDGKDDQGNALSSGIYLYRLETKDFRETRKLLLTK